MKIKKKLGKSPEVGVLLLPLLAVGGVVLLAVVGVFVPLVVVYV